MNTNDRGAPLSTPTLVLLWVGLAVGVVITGVLARWWPRR